ncbi:MAG: AhpC/TSA family protein [Verrucomicrobia bacterium]|nr:AhpC/TSA family protein [Verrucomicrobiota bacterium]
MKKLLVVFAAILIALIATYTLSASDVPQTATGIRPLKVSETIPDVTLRTATGEPFNLRQAILESPTVLIFYRGGWCPYCNRHLGGVQQVEGELRELGFRILAISPDRPEKLREMAEKDQLTFQLLSDSSMAASRAFGIAFQADDATVQQYKEEYQIDIEADSGETHHQLPVPAVFMVDPDGQIIFSYINPDYKTRLDPEALLGTAQMFSYRSKKF